MPWHVAKTSQCPAGKPYGVILDATGKVIKGGCHETKQKAIDHLVALKINVPHAAAGAKQVTMAPLVTLAGVDIVAAGTWRLVSGEATFTTEDLADAIDASTCPSIGSPVIKIGHVDPRFDGEPAVGHVTGMELTAGGAKITGDLAGLPGWLGEIAPSAWPNRSIEAYRDVTCQQGHKHPFVITALALLGVAPPAIGVLNSLEDVAKLYGVAAAASFSSGEKVSVTMSDEPMMGAAITIEDVRRAYHGSAGYGTWITEMQLDPPQLIVCDDATQKLYRVPVKIKGGAVTFGDPLEVEVEYVDVPAQTAAAGRVHFASREQALEGLEPELAAWDKQTAINGIGDNPSKALINAMFALPADTVSDSKLPHHNASGGKVGEANPDGVSSALNVINGGMGGLKGVSDADKRKAYSHLAAHAKAAGQTPPEYKGAAADHGAYSGQHEHSHSAFGSQGGDATHSHMHSHDGNGDHNHQHAGPKTATSAAKVKAGTSRSGKATRKGVADDMFSDEVMAKLRERLGLDEDAELTGEEILAALAEPEPEGEGEGEPEGKPAKGRKPEKLAAAARRLPPGILAVDQGEWEAMQERARKGEQAHLRMQRNERDGAITAAMKDGKFGPARKGIYERLWDADPQGTAELLASMPRQAVPLSDIGQPGGELDEDDFDREFAHLFPPEPKPVKG